MRRITEFKNPRKYQGGWITTLISAGVSLFGAIKGGKAARAADREAAASRQQQGKILDGFLDLSKQADSRSAALFSRYKEKFWPAQDEYLEMAREGLDPEDEAAQALSDVRTQGKITQDMAGRSLRSYGVNPGAGRFGDTTKRLALAEGVAGADAMNKARRAAKDTNFQRLGDAVRVGQGDLHASAQFSSGAAQTLSAAGSLATSMAGSADQRAYDTGSAAGASLADLTSLISGMGKTGGSGGGGSMKDAKIAQMGGGG